MKILVIGSEGFIGSHIVKHYRDRNAILTGCDLYEAAHHIGYRYVKVTRLSPEWEEIFSGDQYDVCVNASGSGHVPLSLQRPLSDFEANALDPIRILDAIRKCNRNCRYLHISSAAVYGNPERLPIREDAAKHPLSPYGWHKLMSELICAEYHTVFGLQTAIVRPFSVYGEGLQKQLLWDICQRLKDSNSIQLFGTGEESRDFIHCEDLAALFEMIIDRGNFQAEVYNGATGIETPIKEIARLFESGYDGSKKISFSGEVRKGDPLNWRADTGLIQKMGFKPAVNIPDGINRYISWYKGLTIE